MVSVKERVWETFTTSLTIAGYFWEILCFSAILDVGLQARKISLYVISIDINKSVRQFTTFAIHKVNFV